MYNTIHGTVIGGDHADLGTACPVTDYVIAYND